MHQQQFSPGQLTNSYMPPGFCPGMIGPAYHFIEAIDDSCYMAMRKEKSRDAARTRRGKENYEFQELGKMLPVPTQIMGQMDKSSVVRLTIAHMKNRELCETGDPSWSGKNYKNVGRSLAICYEIREIFEKKIGHHILESLDGFLFSITHDGRILYVSETVSVYLGLSQVDMIGSTIFDFIHHEDHIGLMKVLNLTYSRRHEPGLYRSPKEVPQTGYVNKSRSGRYNVDKCLCLRFRSTLTKRGVHIKSSGFKVMQITARLKPKSQDEILNNSLPVIGMIGVAISLPSPIVTELQLEPYMFVMKATPSLHITYSESRVYEYLGYSTDYVTNRLLYDFVHVGDISGISKAHKDLKTKGQAVTPYYRWLLRDNGFCWVQTIAMVTCNSKTGDENTVILVNYILSQVEEADTWFNLPSTTSGKEANFPNHACYLKSRKKRRPSVSPPSESKTPKILQTTNDDGENTSLLLLGNSLPRMQFTEVRGIPQALLTPPEDSNSGEVPRYCSVIQSTRNLTAV